jgi:hypothetical protein
MEPRTNIANYRKVAEQGVYREIDQVHFGTQRVIELETG